MVSLRTSKFYKQTILGERKYSRVNTIVAPCTKDMICNLMSDLIYTINAVHTIEYAVKTF